MLSLVFEERRGARVKEKRAGPTGASRRTGPEVAADPHPYFEPTYSLETNEARENGAPRALLNGKNASGRIEPDQLELRDVPSNASRTPESKYVELRSGLKLLDLAP